MAKIALDGAIMVQSTVANHINYRAYEQTGTTPRYCVEWDEDGSCIRREGGDPIMEWVSYQTSATINGTVESSVTNVKINGKAPIVVGDKTKENDTYSLPKGEYVSGQHTNAAGSVTAGNASNVFVNGKLIAINGASIATHAGTSSTISSGVSTTVNIGS